MGFLKKNFKFGKLISRALKIKNRKNLRNAVIGSLKI